MYFSNLLTASALAATAFASLTPIQIAANINILAQKSQSLYSTAQTINNDNAALIASGKGPLVTIVGGFDDIINTASVTVKLLADTPAITSEVDAKLVIDAFNNFAHVNGDLLNVLIGKASALEIDINASVGAGVKADVSVSLNHPVSTILHTFDNTLDEISQHLVNIVDVRTGEIQVDANVLGQTLSVCIGKLEVKAL
ncbi:UVI-1 [Xylaria nigripes]|nr:UVI-1 [Xylaria nigripes]